MGCGDCVLVCPKSLLEMYVDDYDETKVRVKQEAIKTVGFVCPGSNLGQKEGNCRLTCKAVCPSDVFEHSW